MKKLRLDLDSLRVHSFATAGSMALEGCATYDAGSCQRASRGGFCADSGTILTGGLLDTCGRGTVEAYASSEVRCTAPSVCRPRTDETACGSCHHACNHTTA